jgi:hypothetical protein
VGNVSKSKVPNCSELLTEVMVLLLDPPWSWVDTLVPMVSDPAWPNRIGSTPFVTATIPAEELFSGVHAALTVPPFPFVILERSDEAGSGDPLFVLFSLQSCRRAGCCWREGRYLPRGGTFARWGVVGSAGLTSLVIRRGIQAVGESDGGSPFQEGGTGLEVTKSSPM